MIAAAREGKHVSLEAIEDRAEVACALRRWSGQAAFHLGRGRAPQRRRLCVLKAPDQHVHGFIAQRSHGVGIEAQRICGAFRLHSGADPLTGGSGVTGGGPLLDSSPSRWA